MISEYECAFRSRIIKNILKLLIKLSINNKDSYEALFQKYNLTTLSSAKNAMNKSFPKKPLYIKKSSSITIDLDCEGIIYRRDDFRNKYIMNNTCMAIWDLLDGKRTVNSIAMKIAELCEVNIKDIEDDISNQLATLEELGFIEEVNNEKDSDL